MIFRHLWKVIQGPCWLPHLAICCMLSHAGNHPQSQEPFSGDFRVPDLGLAPVSYSNSEYCTSSREYFCPNTYPCFQVATTTSASPSEQLMIGIIHRLIDYNVEEQQAARHIPAANASSDDGMTNSEDGEFAVQQAAM